MSITQIFQRVASSSTIKSEIIKSITIPKLFRKLSVVAPDYSGLGLR